MLLIEEVTLSHCRYEIHLQLIDMDKKKSVLSLIQMHIDQSVVAFPITIFMSNLPRDVCGASSHNQMFSGWYLCWAQWLLKMHLVTFRHYTSKNLKPERRKESAKNIDTVL